jgi:hypothetical protein
MHASQEEEPFEIKLVVPGSHAAKGTPVEEQQQQDHHVNNEDNDDVIPRSKKAETKPPYVSPGCSNYTYNNNMINRSMFNNTE